MNKDSQEYAQAVISAAKEFKTLIAKNPQLSAKEIADLRDYVRIRTDLKKSDEALTNEEGAWKLIYDKLDASLLEQLGPEKKKEIDVAAENIFRLTKIQKIIPELSTIGLKVEDLFIEQYDRIAFWKNDTDNEYRVQEKRLSNLILDRSVSKEKHMEFASTIIRLADQYNDACIKPLSILNDDIQQLLLRFEQLLMELPEQNEFDASDLLKNLQRWLSLSKELHSARIKATTSIASFVELDKVIPAAIIECHGDADRGLQADRAAQFQKDLMISRTEMIESGEANEKIQAEREPLAKKIFCSTQKSNKTADDQRDPDQTQDNSIPVSHPLEGKVWFRLTKILYIAAWVIGLGLLAVMGLITANVGVIVGAAILAGCLLLLRSVFYYVVLGRTSAREPAHSGYLDLDELETFMAGIRTSDPVRYQEVIAPTIESWKRQHGRRIPAVIVAQLAEQEKDRAATRRREIVKNAATQGKSIEISALRESMERAKADYKGPDRDQFIRAIDHQILSLEAKYGTTIPINDALSILEHLETKEHKYANK